MIVTCQSITNGLGFLASICTWIGTTLVLNPQICTNGIRTLSLCQNNFSTIFRTLQEFRTVANPDSRFGQNLDSISRAHILSFWSQNSKLLPILERSVCPLQFFCLVLPQNLPRTRSCFLITLHCHWLPRFGQPSIIRSQLMLYCFDSLNSKTRLLNTSQPTYHTNIMIFGVV